MCPYCLPRGAPDDAVAEEPKVIPVMTELGGYGDKQWRLEARRCGRSTVSGSDEREEERLQNLHSDPPPPESASNFDRRRDDAPPDRASE